MLDKLKALLFETPGGTKATNALAREQAAAILLYEAAASDGSVGAEEDSQIRNLLQKRFDLSEQEAIEIAAKAMDAQAKAVEISTFTRTVKSEFDADERIELIEMLWEVVYADGVVDDFEANLLRRIGGLLYVTDKDNGAARKRVARKLGLSDSAA